MVNAISADLLMENDCEQVLYSCCTQLGLQPTAGQRPPGQGPGTVGGRSPAVETCEGWGDFLCGVCGHLLDSLPAWDHFDTLLKPEQAHFGRLYEIMFFRKGSPQTEGRRDADHKIKYQNVAGLHLRRLRFSNGAR